MFDRGVFSLRMYVWSIFIWVLMRVLCMLPLGSLLIVRLVSGWYGGFCGGAPAKVYIVHPTRVF